MNTGSLRQLVDQLLQAENNFGVQGILDELGAHLQNLMNNPQDQNFQLKYSKTLDRLSQVVTEMAATFTPAQAKAVEEIRAGQFFLEDFPSDIRALTAANALTPAVIRDRLLAITSERKQFLDSLRELQTQLARIGVESPLPQAGEAEIGILIPRAVFHNHLDEFAKELGVLNNILRVFSEFATGTAEPVEVHQISTSDPTLFLGITAHTVHMIGDTVTWALATLASVLGLKKLRAEAANTKVYSDEEMRSMFDDKAKSIVDKAVEERVKKIMAEAKTDRKEELESGLKWAVETVFAKVERGMTVELRFLPPRR